ncbi:MAG: serine--tRNA ligase, partial [Clostridia bacterium]|nr:serine--tRNA ligase [Clostridia bacterium]
EMKVIGQQISDNDIKLKEFNDKIQSFLNYLPNTPDEDLLAGGKENNVVIKEFGTKPNFDFTIKNHTELCELNGIIDYKRGSKLAGSGYWIYCDVGARLEWAILNYFISEHLKDNYKFMLVPHMLSYNCGYGAGQFPKFSDEVYWINDDEGESQKFMLPTAETALVNLHSGEILSENELPKKYFSYTPCYRKEAGSYRTEERGMIRGHQFNKVEMVQYTTPENSMKAFEELVGKAESLVKKLGLHFRTSKLAAGDCSASMARTYDIEVWIPSMNIYKEVSSVSNANDYQARRTNTKYRNFVTGKTEFVHTLNGSGLATSRIIPAIVEQYQQKDGSIIVPEVLVPFFGEKVINPIK